MSSRSRIAIFYGVLSIGWLGALLGTAASGSDAWQVCLIGLLSIQAVFLFISIGYSAGSDDQRLGRLNKTSL